MNLESKEFKALKKKTETVENELTRVIFDIMKKDIPMEEKKESVGMMVAFYMQTMTLTAVTEAVRWKLEKPNNEE